MKRLQDTTLARALFIFLSTLSSSFAAELPPVITAPPQSKSVSLGANVTMQVSASGTAPFSYQWQLHSLNLVDQTNRSITFTNVPLSLAGNYRVIVANAFGSATS